MESPQFTRRYVRTRNRFLCVGAVPIAVISAYLASLVVPQNLVGAGLIALLISSASIESAKLFKAISQSELAHKARPLRKPSKDPSNPDVTPHELRRLSGPMVNLALLIGVDTGVYLTGRGVSSIISALLAVPAFVVAAVILSCLAFVCQI